MAQQHADNGDSTPPIERGYIGRACGTLHTLRLSGDLRQGKHQTIAEAPATFAADLAILKVAPQVSLTAPSSLESRSYATNS